MGWGGDHGDLIMVDCADDVVAAYPLFQAADGGSIPTSALDLYFSTTNREIFRRCNRLWHSRLPLIGSSCGRAYYMAESGGRIWAVAMWSNPVARLLPQSTWLELRRFAIADGAPRNTASRMLGWMTRDLWRRFPEIERLISYQDCVAHRGVIYRATGWIEAEKYVSRRRGWKATTGWASRFRAGRTHQSVSPRMRWEKLRPSGLRRPGAKPPMPQGASSGRQPRPF